MGCCLLLNFPLCYCDLSPRLDVVRLKRTASLPPNYSLSRLGPAC
jgi:hypothetical protein